ncbi:MAG: PA2779 family protein [Pseudomonadota bacterium]
MKQMLCHPAVRLICWYLVFTLSGVFVTPLTAQAAFISPSQEILSGVKPGSLEAVKESLENGLLSEKLTALGLSPDEIRIRLDSLTPDERQAVIDDVDQIQAGGNGVVTLLIIILLVVLILKLSDKEIIIK